MLLWFAYLFNFDNTVELTSGTDDKSNGQSLSRDNPSRRQGARAERKAYIGRQLKLCLRVIWTCCWLLQRHDLDTDGKNAALSLDSNIMWVGTMFTPEFLHDSVVWVLSCHFIKKSQHPFSICSSSLCLSQSVRAGVSYLIETNFWYFLALSLVGLPRLLLSVGLTAEQVERSNYRVLTPFADNAVVLVFLHWSTVMRCELNSTHTSANHLWTKQYLAAIQPIIWS